MGDRFVLDEAILTGRLNGLLIEVHCVEIAALDARDLCGDQFCPVSEILGAVLGQYNDLLVVGGECLAMPGPLLGRCSVVLCRPGERVIEKVFGRLKMSRRLQ